MAACVCGYNTVAALARHKRTCKVIAWHAKCQAAQAKNDELEKELVELKADHLREKTALLQEIAELREAKSRIPKLEEKVTELRGRLDESRKARPNVQNMTINILPYGQEVPLTMEQVRPLMNLPSESVPRYVEMKHFQRPETANIRIPNKRGRTIQVVEEDKDGKRRRWVDKDRQEILSKITDASLDELIEHYNAGNDVLWNKWFENNGLKDEGYDKTETFRQLVRKVENVITSQRSHNVVDDSM